MSDPFKRLPIRPVIYWDWENKKKKPEEAAAPAAAAPAAAKGAGSSSDPLVVDTAAAAAQADTLISPGFGALMDGGEPRVDPEDVVPQEGDGQLIVPTGAADDGDEVVGPDGKALPKLSGGARRRTPSSWTLTLRRRSTRARRRPSRSPSR